MVGSDDARIVGDVIDDLLTAATTMVLDPYPITFNDAILLGSIGMHAYLRIGLDGTHTGEHAVLRMEVAPHAGSCGQHERIFLFILGAHLVRVRTLRRFVPDRCRTPPPLFERIDGELEAAGNGVEARLTVGTGKALLVLLVLQGRIVEHLFYQILEILTIPAAPIGTFFQEEVEQADVISDAELLQKIGVALPYHLHDELFIRNSFTGSIYDLRDGTHGRVPRTEAVALGTHGDGEHQIGAGHGGRRHEDISHSHEVK